MKTWWTADLHLGHAAVIKYCRRPFATIEEHDRVVLKNLNQRVKPDDILMLLGDASLSNPKQIREYRDRINCETIILVQGNHDKNALTAWDFVCYFMQKRIAGKLVNISHYPYRPGWWWRLWNPGQLKFMMRRSVNRGLWLLHGHTHSKNRVYSKSINVGLDAWNMCPVSEKQICQIIQRGH